MSFNERFVCLLGITARIYDLYDGSLDKHKLCSLVPCCCNDGYRDQVPQQPISMLV